MTTKSATDILKEAILLERKGKTFYSTVASHTKSEAVKKIFSMMAEEEEQHIRFLSDQYKFFSKTGLFDKSFKHAEDPKKSLAMEVFTKEIKKQITAASYEAAAISAAIDFETRAIQVYSDRAANATDTNEKESYQMLADWEKTHHFWLNKLNEELKESVWFDNQFWPF